MFYAFYTTDYKSAYEVLKSKAITIALDRSFIKLRAYDMLYVIVYLLLSYYAGNPLLKSKSIS